MKLSVVVAAYNEEKLIGKCIDAIQKQDYPKKDYEIVIVDNNSTDNTKKIVESFGIKPILYKKHQGAIFAKNHAVTKAKGEIVAVTDADSIPSKNWLKSIDAQMNDNKIHLAGGKVLPIKREFMSTLLLQIFDKFAKILQFVGIPLIWGSNMAVRKKSFDKVGGFNTKINISDDWEFTMRIQKEFGKTSAKYTDKLFVRVSPRKFKSISTFLPYFTNGLFSFISIFILKRAWNYGNFVNVR